MTKKEPFPKAFQQEIKQVFKSKPWDKAFQEQELDLPKKVKHKLLQDAKFFAEHGGKTDSLLKIKKQQELASKAYPNYDSYFFIQPQRDTKKWIKAAQEFYFLKHQGYDPLQSFEQITYGWERLEKMDFESWLKFYQEGAHNKYKVAGEQEIPMINKQNKIAQMSYWEDVNRAGYFVPMPQENKADAPQQTNVPQNIDKLRNQETHPDVSQAQKREVIEIQRNKIIGRLDSAEKLLRSQEGALFAGNEFEGLLEIIYQLKKKIHMVNKLSVSSRLYEDMIVREANILNHKGLIKSASLLHSIAQSIPSAAEANNPLQFSGNPGNIPGEGPGLTPPGAGPFSDTSAPSDPTGQAIPPAPPGIAAGKNPGTPPGQAEANAPSEGIKEFLEGLDTANDTFDTDDEEGAEDVLEVYDQDLVITAQELPLKNPPIVDRVNPNVQENIPNDKDFDELLDTAFAGLSINDVVVKLEDVAKVFKVREIPRQLAFIDLMLNQLGLASLFPSLAEAINKSLESNQYISTRVDEILSRLRGTLKTNDIDLTGNEQESNPAGQQAKEQLMQENDQEKARKKMRKDQENQELNPTKITPEVDIAGDMAGEVPPTAPQAPVAKPVPPPIK